MNDLVGESVSIETVLNPVRFGRKQNVLSGSIRMKKEQWVTLKFSQSLCQPFFVINTYLRDTHSRWKWFLIFPMVGTALYVFLVYGININPSTFSFAYFTNTINKPNPTDASQRYLLDCSLTVQILYDIFWNKIK